MYDYEAKKDGKFYRVGVCRRCYKPQEMAIKDGAWPKNTLIFSPSHCKHCGHTSKDENGSIMDYFFTVCIIKWESKYHYKVVETSKFFGLIKKKVQVYDNTLVGHWVLSDGTPLMEYMGSTFPGTILYKDMDFMMNRGLDADGDIYNYQVVMLKGE